MSKDKIKMNKDKIEKIIQDMEENGDKDLALWFIENLKKYYDNKLTITQNKSFEKVVKKLLA